MTELIVYGLFGLAFLLFVTLGRAQKRHNWYEVSSADVSKAIRKGRKR
jgi:hypothetical protein